MLLREQSSCMKSTGTTSSQRGDWAKTISWDSLEAAKSLPGTTRMERPVVWTGENGCATVNCISWGEKTLYHNHKNGNYKPTPTPTQQPQFTQANSEVHMCIHHHIDEPVCGINSKQNTCSLNVKWSRGRGYTASIFTQEGTIQNIYIFIMSTLLLHILLYKVKTSWNK